MLSGAVSTFLCSVTYDLEPLRYVDSCCEGGDL